jgi:hypothetical protein
MDQYDWGWSRGYGREYGMQPGRRYGADFGMGTRWRGAGMVWGGPGYASDYGAPAGGYGGWRTGRGMMGRGYDRDVYGQRYPGYGGYTAGQDRGMTGYDRGFNRGYDRGFAQGPFVPETAYREHPEMDRPQRGMRGRWGGGHSHTAGYGEVDDDEIRSTVEQSLQQDTWVDAGSIKVEVDDQVVTLEGEVGDYLEARYAWDDAWDTAGVRGVINNLTVRLDQAARKHEDPFLESEVDTETSSQSGGTKRRSRK